MKDVIWNGFPILAARLDVEAGSLLDATGAAVSTGSTSAPGSAAMTSFLLEATRARGPGLPLAPWIAEELSVAGFPRLAGAAANRFRCTGGGWEEADRILRSSLTCVDAIGSDAAAGLAFLSRWI